MGGRTCKVEGRTSAMNCWIRERQQLVHWKTESEFSKVLSQFFDRHWGTFEFLKPVKETAQPPPSVESISDSTKQKLKNKSAKRKLDQEENSSSSPLPRKAQRCWWNIPLPSGTRICAKADGYVWHISTSHANSKGVVHITRDTLGTEGSADTTPLRGSTTIHSSSSPGVAVPLQKVLVFESSVLTALQTLSISNRKALLLIGSLEIGEGGDNLEKLLEDPSMPCQPRIHLFDLLTDSWVWRDCVLPFEAPCVDFENAQVCYESTARDAYRESFVLAVLANHSVSLLRIGLMPSILAPMATSYNHLLAFSRGSGSGEEVPEATFALKGCVAGYSNVVLTVLLKIANDVYMAVWSNSTAAEIMLWSKCEKDFVEDESFGFNATDIGTAVRAAAFYGLTLQDFKYLKTLQRIIQLSVANDDFSMFVDFLKQTMLLKEKNQSSRNSNSWLYHPVLLQALRIDTQSLLQQWLDAYSIDHFDQNLIKKSLCRRTSGGGGGGLFASPLEKEKEEEKLLIEKRLAENLSNVTAIEILKLCKNIYME